MLCSQLSKTSSQSLVLVKVKDGAREYINKLNKRYYETHDPKDLKITLWRWNVSGEIQNVNELMLMNKLAAQHPEVMFGIYTKNFQALEEFFNVVKDVQSNFVINISQWHHVADEIIKKLQGRCNIFEYDDSNLKHHDLSEEDVKRLSMLSHCKAVTKEGRHASLPNGKPITCDKCTRCYRKTGEHIAVYAH